MTGKTKQANSYENDMSKRFREQKSIRQNKNLGENGNSHVLLKGEFAHLKSVHDKKYVLFFATTWKPLSSSNSD